MQKRDINLLPRKKKVPKSISLGVPFAILAMILVGILGVFLPKMALDGEKAELVEYQKLLENYTTVQEDFRIANERYLNLTMQKENYEEFVGTKREVLDMYMVVNNAKPEGVFLSDQSYSIDTIILKGFAASDILIGDFYRALEDTGLFQDINFDSPISTVENQRLFSFELVYPVIVATETGGN